MAILENCTNCKYWDDNVDRDADASYRNTHGLCKKAEFDDGYNHPDDSNPMITRDGSGYIGKLYTRCDHCCKAYKEEVS